MRDESTQAASGASNHRTRGRLFRLAGLGGLLAASLLLLAACSDDDGGGDDSDSEATETATESMTETATATEAMTETATATESSTETATATESAGGGATGDTTISVATEGDLAPYLVGPDGMTLYLFTNDEEGVSNCTGQCIENWPPLIVEDGEPTASEDAPGELGTIEREDGLGTQVTYNGMPLYYWQGDSAPGDTTGHEVGDVWFVVPPEGDATMSNMSGGDSSMTNTASGTTSNTPDY